jgi:alpha-galactosidase
MARFAIRILLGITVLCCFGAQARATEPTPQENKTAEKWAAANFSSDVAKLPFSFVYDGVPSSKLLPKWKVQRGSSELDKFRAQKTLTFTDPKTHLEVRCVMVYFKDYPSVEWTVYFKNNGSVATPILENIQAVEIDLDRGQGPEFLLHYSKGSPSVVTDYEPEEMSLEPKKDQRFAPVGGRPTDGAFPYFNLSHGDQDIILAIGWPGQWAAQFTRDEGSKLHIRGGQETTHFALQTAEEVRSPLVEIQFYEGDWIRSQNLWRRWLVAHVVPRPAGLLPTPLLAGGSCPYFGPFIGNNEQNQEEFIRRYGEEGIKIDYWWIDAGWYPNNGKWTDTGTWQVDTKRFPNGLKAVSDYAHARDEKLIVWFEPERVTPHTELYDQHPEWLLKVDPTPDFKPSQEGWRLLNLGDPAARMWITDRVDKLITDQGIDWYRQDFNMQALPFWKVADTPDRQGMTENHYVTGYLAYWDALKQRHPSMPIDSCASGGRRNDLETMRRAVPLWRSDYLVGAVAMQDQTYGISLWFPFEGLASQTVETPNESGTGKTIDAYSFRSDMYPSIHAHWDVRRTDLDYKRLRELVKQWRDISPDYMGDYYPLTPFSGADDAWVAWQFDRPEAGEGMVQAFRRPGNTQESAHLKLRGLEPGARYKVINLDHPADLSMSGHELMDSGLPIELKAKPDSAIVTYKREEK